MLKNVTQTGNTFTDSQSALSTAHVFAQQWKIQGYDNINKKTDSPRRAHIKFVKVPLKVAICKCAAPIRHVLISINHKADEEVANKCNTLYMN